MPNPVLDEYLRLAGHLGCDVSDRQTEAAVLPHDEQELARFWQQSDPRFAADGVLCLESGRRVRLVEALAHRKLLADLARRIVDNLGPFHGALVLCGPAERDEARADRAASRAATGRQLRRFSHEHRPDQGGSPVGRIAGDDRLGSAAFCAALLATVVTLFGPTHQAWSEPTTASHPVADQSRLWPVSAPQMSPDPSHRCMRDLSIERAYDAVISQLHTQPS